jgi:hypothetical protein
MQTTVGGPSGDPPDMKRVGAGAMRVFDDAIRRQVTLVTDAANLNLRV